MKTGGWRMFWDEYDNLQENWYVRSSPADYARLRESIAQIRRGEGIVRELAEDSES